jgi:hypothetical protein
LPHHLVFGAMNQLSVWRFVLNHKKW